MIFVRSLFCFCVDFAVVSLSSHVTRKRDLYAQCFRWWFLIPTNKHTMAPNKSNENDKNLRCILLTQYLGSWIKWKVVCARVFRVLLFTLTFIFGWFSIRNIYTKYSVGVLLGEQRSCCNIVVFCCFNLIWFFSFVVIDGELNWLAINHMVLF